MTLYDLRTVQVNSRRIDRTEYDIFHRIEQRSYPHGIRTAKRHTSTSHLSATTASTSSLLVVGRHWRHRCHHYKFQVTEVNTHFHGCRTSKDIQAMVFEVFLHLTAHHLIHLGCMFCLYKEVGELIDLEQSVGESSILSPKSVLPKNLTVFLCPILNNLTLRTWIVTENMIRICYPFFMKFFTQGHRFSSHKIWSITMECRLHRAQPFHMMVVTSSVCIT